MGDDDEKMVWQFVNVNVNWFYSLIATFLASADGGAWGPESTQTDNDESDLQQLIQNIIAMPKKMMMKRLKGGLNQRREIHSLSSLSADQSFLDQQETQGSLDQQENQGSLNHQQQNPQFPA